MNLASLFLFFLFFTFLLLRPFENSSDDAMQSDDLQSAGVKLGEVILSSDH